MTRTLLILLAACSSAPPSLAVASVDDLGPLVMSRDGGQSGALGDQVMWTFGDTFLGHANAIDGESLLSATGAWATVAAPMAIAPAMDGADLAQIIPYTSDEIAANRADPQQGYALWPGPMLALDDATGVIAFERVARNGGPFLTEGIGTARIGAGSAIATRAPDLLFAAPDPLFEPHAVVDDFAYAYACDQRGFLDFACKLGRAPRAQLDARAAYTFFDGTGWVADAASAAYVIDQTSVAPSISYNAHLGRYLAVTCDIVSSTIRLRTAAAVEGPWDDATSATIEASADGATGIYAPTMTDQYNYLCLEHAELASADGREIVVGYSRPTAPFVGEVRLAHIVLE